MPSPSNPSDDLRSIFKATQEFADHCYRRRAEKFIIVLDDGRRISFPIPDILICSIKTVEVVKPKASTHTDDFRSVNWFGQQYSFSETQALIVKALWEAWENGTLEVTQEALLKHANSLSTRLQSIFKDHEAFGNGKMIIEGKGRGTYRLNPPPDLS